LAEGKVAWLKKVKDGRLHGRVDTVGAITRRCTHFGPNLAQAPKVSVEYGEEMRGCFIADVGYVLGGWDASGLELRCLGHYVARFDGGAYKDIILLGDVHTKNMQAIGLFGRNFAKTWIYAYLYGAGDLKLGSIVIEDARYAGEDVPKGSVKAIGKRSRDNYERDVAALKKLREGIDTRAKKNGGFMNAIDGGSIVVRHAHAALNTLLQSAGAIAMKLALVILYDKLTALGWTHGVQYAFVLNIHDEVQACVLPTHVQTYKECAVAAIREAGEQLGFRCQLDAEAKEGNSWADTH
jgi:DNA polymerase-1